METNIKNKLEELRNIYNNNLSGSVIPFWFKNSPDWEYGGTYSCLDRKGEVYDNKKYIWLIGRSSWMFSRLYNEYDKNRDYLEIAALGINFLNKYAMDGQGRYYFSLTREGKPWFFQRKPYGAVFAMLAYLEYFKSTGIEKFKKDAVQLFWKINEWIEDSTKLSRPLMEGVPSMTNLASIMVIASMAIELTQIDDDPRYKEIMKQSLDGCRRHFDPGLRILIENVPYEEKINSKQWPEGRLFNPGHSIEVAWFILQVVRFIPDKQMTDLALEVLEGSLNLGWDKEYGGLYYFMDIEGKPTLQLESDMKLWWPHTEAIYALVLAFSRSKDSKWLSWLEKVHDYTFKHFVDLQHGEWFGYCDRQGNISNQCKGGNYKGFFHVPRALLYCVQEIDKCLKEIQDVAK